MKLLKTLVLALILFAGCDNSKKEKPPIGVNENDKEINAAIEQARKTIDHFIKELESGKPGKAYIVKFEVEAEGHIEHIWAGKLTYSNNTFTGILLNTPYKIKSIKKGDRFSAKKDEISDWLIYDANNKNEGGFTQKILDKRREKNKSE